MTFAEFVSKHYREEPGRAVSLESITRHFYESNPLASFDYPPAAIKMFLKSRFPIGTIRNEAHCGNLAGDDSILVCDRALVVFGGELLPRDLRPDEFALYGRATRHFKRQVTTLTRTEQTARGWGRVTLSRADWLATLKTDY
jgi:hypothetical protein